MRNLFYKWKNYNLDNKLIEINKLPIRRANLNILRVVSILCSVLMILGTLFPIFFSHNINTLIAYIICSLVSILFLFATTALLRKPDKIVSKWPFPLLYFSFIVFMYAFGLYISVITSTEHPAVLINIIFLCSQLLFCISAISSLILAVLAYIAFVAVSIYFKDYSIWMYDASNALVTLIASVSIGWYVSRVKYTSILSSYELEIANKKLYDSSIKDTLTGLYNRSKFFEELTSYTKRCQDGEIYLYVSIIDIDFFKDYNDTFGHNAGDIVLRKLSQYMLDFASTRDMLFCRWGGEEFVCVGSLTSENEGLPLISELVAGIEALHIDTANKSVSEYVTASAGVSIVPIGAMVNWMNEYNASDAALYKSKVTGRNKVSI